MTRTISVFAIAVAAAMGDPAAGQRATEPPFARSA
jgi:hypothetical protein